MSIHCCIKMDGALEEHNSPLIYVPYKRIYYMQYFPIKKMRKNQVATAEPLHYCPWCGKQLPKDLMDQWRQIVKQEFGVTNTLDTEEYKKIPAEYLSDEWWKKRGL